MDTGQLVSGRAGNMYHVPHHYDTEVTCKVEWANGVTKMYNALFKFKGAPVTGIELDHEAEFNLEYGRPQGDLVIFGFSGMIHKINAWITTADGPQVVLEATFQSSLRVREGDAIPVAGPELRYVM